MIVCSLWLVVSDLLMEMPQFVRSIYTLAGIGQTERGVLYGG
jgi:hypothetical protein